MRRKGRSVSARRDRGTGPIIKNKSSPPGNGIDDPLQHGGGGGGKNAYREQDAAKKRGRGLSLLKVLEDSGENGQQWQNGESPPFTKLETENRSKAQSTEALSQTECHRGVPVILK